MKNTIGELIDRVQSLYSKGVKSDDSRLSNRHIYSVLKSARSLLISQQVRKKQKISDWNYTLLSCIELIKVPNHDCPCLPNIGCKVFRTKYPLPKTLTDLNSHLIDWVMTINSGKIIDEITRDAYIYNAGNKYTNKHLKYILENGYLYIYGENIPNVIKAKILAEDPIDAEMFPSLCEDCIDCQDCDSMLDKVFPIDADLVKTLIEIAAQELVVMFSQAQEDQTNNAADSNREQSK